MICVEQGPECAERNFVKRTACFDKFCRKAPSMQKSNNLKPPLARTQPTTTRSRVVVRWGEIGNIGSEFKNQQASLSISRSA